MSMSSAHEEGRSYRERDVDSTLSDHERRIGRLEKVALIGIGYGLAEGGNLVTQLTGLFL